MLPLNMASSIGVPGNFLAGDDLDSAPLIDYEMAGIALNDASQGQRVQVWKLFYLADTAYLQPLSSGDTTTLFVIPGISEIALAFDQNMRPQVAYTLNGELNLRWWDTNANAFVTTNYGAGRNPKMALDDKRETQSSNSDVIFAYLQNNGLYYRQQRDRYTIQRLLRDNIDPTLKLTKIGMGTNNRMIFQIV